MTTRTRRAQTRRASYHPTSGVLALTINGVEDAYYLEALPCDFGPGVRAFALDRFRCQRQAGKPDSYALTICPADPAACSCECRGWLRWGRCKHVSALLALTQAGRLS